MAITAAARKKAEAFIFATLDQYDKSGTNSSHYKGIFSKMTDKQFEDLFKKKYPIRLHIKPMEIEPSMKDIIDALNFMDVPLMEEVNMPNMYTDEDGNPVKSKPALVGYIPMRREQQIITKKNAMSTDTSSVDMKTGLLIHGDKNGKTSDREAAGLLTVGLTATVNEFNGPRADRMNAKNVMNSEIRAKGMVSQKDIPNEIKDSLAMNLFNTYMLGSHLYTNVLNKDYMTPYTLEQKGNKQIKRK